jgi:hypothetical protein
MITENLIGQVRDVVLVSVRVVLVVTKVVVIRLAVAYGKEKGDSMDDWLGSGVFAKVLGLVPPKDAFWLVLWSRATRKFLVEVNDALHPQRVWGRSDGLWRCDLRRDQCGKGAAKDETHFDGR